MKNNNKIGVVYGLIITIVLLFLGVVAAYFIVTDKIQKYEDTLVKIYEKIQEERNWFISKSTLFMEECKDCSMNTKRKVEVLNIIFNKSLEYRNKFYIEPTFVLYHIRAESGFNEKAIGGHGEKTIFQYHSIKIKEACVIYKVGEEDFLNNISLQIDFYYVLMTEYLYFYKGDYEKALLTYNCGEGIIEAYSENIDTLKKNVYTENKKNPRKAYCDVILDKYKER